MPMTKVVMPTTIARALCTGVNFSTPRCILLLILSTLSIIRSLMLLACPCCAGLFRNSGTPDRLRDHGLGFEWCGIVGDRDGDTGKAKARAVEL